jgi:hypothetical protein
VKQATRPPATTDNERASRHTLIQESEIESNSLLKREIQNGTLFIQNFMAGTLSRVRTKIIKKTLCSNGRYVKNRNTSFDSPIHTFAKYQYVLLRERL